MLDPWFLATFFVAVAYILTIDLGQEDRYLYLKV
jgi:hypothetical protein